MEMIVEGSLVGKAAKEVAVILPIIFD